MLEELLIINEIGAGVAVLGVILCVSWSRAVRGFWPGRRKIFALSMVFVAIWLLGNVFYFYLKFHQAGA
jgi:hypothetical protein